MNLNIMRYKNYVWPHNPSNIEVSVTRDLREINIPFKGSLIQDYGQEKRIVSGSGQFFGEDCIDQFESLFTIFKQNGSGYLVLPGITPFLAIFSELHLIGNTMPNIINYEFEFWEDLSSNIVSVDLNEGYHTVAEGDTLWSIALKYSLSVEELLNLNVNIKNPNKLVVGEKVKLK